MNSKGLLGLVAATAVVIVLAVFALDRGNTAAADNAAGGPERGSNFYAGLLEQVNDVARIEVTRGAETFAVERVGNEWGLPDRGGYPVKMDTVKQAIVGIADLDVVEAKTKNPAYHGKLGVDDPEDPEGTAKRVVLKDSEGTALAELILGNTKYGTTPSLYVRRVGEDQAWQCSGRLDVPVDPLAWIERKVAQIGRERIASATLRHPDGETLSASRQSPEDTQWDLAEVPPGRELASAGAPATLATWLTYLSLEDVRRGDEVDLSTEPRASFECRMFDGMQIQVETARFEDQTWARLSASYAEPPAEDPVTEDPETTDGETATETETAVDPQAIQAEVEAFNATHGPWAYVLPSYKVTQLEQHLEELLVPLPDPAEDVEPADEAAAPLTDAVSEQPGE